MSLEFKLSLSLSTFAFLSHSPSLYLCLSFHPTMCLLQVRGGRLGGAEDPPAPGEEAQPGQRRPHRKQENRCQQTQF